MNKTSVQGNCFDGLDAVYYQIADELNSHAGGAPSSGDGHSPAFIEYLKLLYAPHEAELVRHLRVTREFYAAGFNPYEYRSVAEVAELTGLSRDEVRSVLDSLVDRSALLGSSRLLGRSWFETVKKIVSIIRIVYGGSGPVGVLAFLFRTIRRNGALLMKYGPHRVGGIINMPMYALPGYPSLLNVHQFHEEVRPGDIRAAQLYQEFFIKDKYYQRYETSDCKTPTFRTIPVKRVVGEGQRILAAEEAHSIIDASRHVALVPCPCRTRTEKLGIRECRERNHVGSCIMLNLSALHFVAVGIGKPVTGEEAKAYLDDMQDRGLMAATENYSNIMHAVICLCCGCCCSMLRGRTRWDNPHAVLPSDFFPIRNKGCVLCGRCAKRCPVGAIKIDRQEKVFTVDRMKCLGCGVCVVGCSTGTLVLKRLRRLRKPRSFREMYDIIERENV